jgi:hypothetical protein
MYIYIYIIFLEVCCSFEVYIYVLLIKRCNDIGLEAWKPRRETTWPFGVACWFLRRITPKCHCSDKCLSDGTRGPLGLCIPESFLKDRYVEELNQKYSGEMFVFSSESRGHFMVAGTFLTLCHGLLSSAFEKQRKKYSLDHSVPGLVLADAWSGFHAFRDGTDSSTSLDPRRMCSLICFCFW